MTGSSKSKAKVELPHVLIEAVKEGRAVIVFGAGASMECRSADSRRPPSADELRDHLAAKFLGTKNEKRDLATVAEMAINAGAGEPQVFDEVARQFKDFTTSEAQEKLAHHSAIASLSVNSNVRAGRPCCNGRPARLAHDPKPLSIDTINIRSCRISIVHS